MPRSFLITNRRYRTSSTHDHDVIDDADDVSFSPSSSWSRDEGSQDSVSVGNEMPSHDDFDVVRGQPLTAYNRLDHLVSPPASTDVTSYWDNSYHHHQVPFFDQLLPALLRHVTDISRSESGKEDGGRSEDMAGVGGGDSFACSDCTKRYSSASNLARHRVSHQRSTTSSTTTDRRVRQCPHCAKVYNSIPAYSMHVRTHTQGCACPHCGKRFSRPWLLQGHVRTHTGERPFRCPQCSKTFADKSNLRAHVQTHSAHKPYSCARCGKAFALKSYLYKHEESSCMRAGLGTTITTEYRGLHRQQITQSQPISSSFIARSYL